MQGGHDKCALVMSAFVNQHGAIQVHSRCREDTTSARMWCPLANQAPGDVADGVGRADQRDEKQHGKQDDAGLSNHVVDATGQRASSPLVNDWHQSCD